MRSRRHHESGAALALSLLLAARLAHADVPEPPSEPPPEAGDGDYTLEAADTLSDDEFELAVAAAGGSGSRVRRSQRVSFRGGGARGTLRDGDDALAGGRLQTTFAGGTLAAGRMAPRWARGLVLGGAAEPWSRRADDRGDGAVFRGRSGDGVAFETARASLLSGRFHKRQLTAARVRAGSTALGVLAARHGCSGQRRLGRRRARARAGVRLARSLARRDCVHG